MTGWVGRIVVAVVVAVVVGLVLSALIGPILAGLAVPIAVTVGDFFVKYGWTLGVLAGLYYVFAGYRRYPPPGAGA